MSLLGMYGNYKADFDSISLRARELLLLASAPLIIYPVKGVTSQPSTDTLYGEITQKQYDPPREIIGFFENPTLLQELVKMGIDIPESVTIYFDIPLLTLQLGRMINIGDVIQPYHQRQQYWYVERSVPNQATERLFKYTQWMAMAAKRPLTGLKLPDYIAFTGLISWFTFSNHWKTEQLQDRQTYLDGRNYTIKGCLNSFWNKGDFFVPKEIGVFNGEDTYLNFSSDYNLGANPFTLSVFIKPLTLTDEFVLFQKGTDFYIKILANGGVSIKVGSNTYSSASGVIVAGSWQQLSFTMSTTPSNVKLYVNAIAKSLGTISSVSAYNINNTDDFLVGYSGESGDSFYNGYMSNLMIYNVALTATQITNNYNSLVARAFSSI